MSWFWTLCAILTSFAAALAFRRALDWNRIGRTTAWLVSSLVTALAPWLVPDSALSRRFVPALVSVAVLVKLYDLFRQPALAQRLTLTSYVSYLANWFWLVLRRPPAIVPFHRDLKQSIDTVPLLLLMGCVCTVVFSIDYSDLPFAIEHCCKVVTLVTTVILLANFSSRVWRLLGGNALEPMRNPAFAHTPADFWRRWNRPAHQFFQEYAFLASDGLRYPIRGILVAFAVSGIVHEYVFGIATGRVQGWQFLYFLLNGLATVATVRIRPQGWMVLPFVAATFAFNLALAVVFFKSVNAVFPFYSPRG
jgi:hypothetical protein